MTNKEFDIQNALGSLPNDMKIELVSNSNTPKEILAKLSTDEDWTVRGSVTENSNTPKEILAKLSTDEDWYIRWSVASNPNTPILNT